MGDAWQFDANFDPTRRERLAAVSSFSDIVTAIEHSLNIVGGWICEATDPGLRSCVRPVVGLSVSEEAFDLFFNSRCGYRAQFLESPEVGQAANDRLLRTLEPFLTEAILADCGSDRLSEQWIRSAFLANSAKVWPDESELDFVRATSDLAIARWQSGCDHINAPLGANLWAPVGTCLLAIGAFIDAFGNEIVSRNKILRRLELHDCGFT